MVTNRMLLNHAFFTNVIAIPMLVLVGLLVSQMLAHAEDPRISPKNVLSVVTEDWNEDGCFDRAVLVVSENDATESDLFIYLSDASTDRMQLVVYKPNIAWVGASWGTLPSLGTHDTGSLVVTSSNQSLGRHRWTQQLTIAYRHEVFVVAGYTYSAYDTLDLDNRVDCDINFLTGKGTRNGTGVESLEKSVAVVDWSEASIPKACQE